MKGLNPKNLHHVSGSSHTAVYIGSYYGSDSEEDVKKTQLDLRQQPKKIKPRTNKKYAHIKSKINSFRPSKTNIITPQRKETSTTVPDSKKSMIPIVQPELNDASIVQTGQRLQQLSDGDDLQERAFAGNGHQRQNDSIRSTYPPTGRGVFGKSTFRPNNFGTTVKSDYSHTIHSENSPMKPKVVTVVRAGSDRPRRKITILLNRRSVQTFEQLIADVSGALGQPKWKNDHIRKLFTLKGKEVRSISDFFREDDAFIAVGKEELTTADVQEVIEELYPDAPYVQSLIRQNLEMQNSKNKKVNNKRQSLGIAEGAKGSKSDSGFDDSTESERRNNDESTNKSPRYDRAKGQHMLNQRRRFQEEDRSRAKRWERERMEREQEELNGELRRRVRGRGRPFGNCNEPNPEMEIKPTIRNAEKSRREKEQWEAEEQERRERKQQELDEKKRRQLEDEKKDREKLQREKDRQRLMDEELVKKRDEAEQEKRRKRLEEEEKMKRKREADRLRKKEEAHLKRVEEERRLRELEAEKEKRRKEDEDRKRQKEEDKKRGENRRNQERETEPEQKVREDEVDKRSPVREKKELQRKMDDTDRTRKTLKYKAPSRGVIMLSDIENRYEIGKTIGDGNFAIVKESRLRNTEAEYAMKIIDKSKLKGKHDMIENEIAIMRNCIHPNIVRLVEEFETDDEIYLILEYVKGGDLFDAITESVKFTERDAANMIADLCEALAFLHERNIVHRDLKPENLLVSRNKDGTMTLKLADFGLAMEVTEPIYTVCGTPTYVAPEILAETGYGLEVDMWATGVITYILLCGFPPFRSHDRNQEELFEIIQLGEFEFLSPYWDTISEAAKDLICKLLVVDSKRRGTAEQILKHPWIRSEGACKKINLQREITMNLERNFVRNKKKNVGPK